MGSEPATSGTASVLGRLGERDGRVRARNRPVLGLPEFDPALQLDRVVDVAVAPDVAALAADDQQHELSSPMLDSFRTVVDLQWKRPPGPSS